MKMTMDQTLPDGISLGVTDIHFTNQARSPEMWRDLLDPLDTQISSNDSLETIRQDPRIMATKQIYKQAGKDPARFRPSSDSLWRRVAKGKGIYQINTLVDLNNYLSLRFKFPFGSYDVDHIDGDVQLTTGSAGQQYAGIGKSMVNIENLLVLADRQGPFGSPTSDSTRAMITEKTQHALIVAYLFGADNQQANAIQATVKQMVMKYLDHVTDLTQQIINELSIL